MEKVKGAGAMLGGVILLLVIIAVPIMLIRGLAEISVWALDWIPDTIGWATFVAVILVPLGVIPATRGLAGLAYSAIAMAYLVCLWLYAMAFTYLEWGLVALIIGIMLAGVGVILTGGLAALFAGEWTGLANIGILFLFVIGANLLGTWLSDLAMRRKLRAEVKERPGGVTIIQSQDGRDAL